MCFLLQGLYSQISLLLSAHRCVASECFCSHLGLELVLLDTDFFKVILRFHRLLCPQSSLTGTELLLEPLHSVPDQGSIDLSPALCSSFIP